MSYPLAALLVAAAAKQAGSLAVRALLRKVPTGTQGVPGEVLRAAMQLHEEAQEVVARAVIYERSRGTSWEVIGKAMKMTRQAAHKHYQDLEHKWQDLPADLTSEDLQRLAENISRIRDIAGGAATGADRSS